MTLDFLILTFFSSETVGKEYNPTEISFAVKQLLLKYLPDEQLAKITYKQAQSAAFNKTGKPSIIPARPEFSFASVEYMKKYNLISNNKGNGVSLNCFL